MLRLASVSVLLLATAATAGTAAIEVIFTEVPGHATALVPGAVDLAGSPIVVEWKAMEILTMSPDGSQWLIKGRHHGGADIETMLVYGSGMTGSVFAQEGQPIPGGAPGELFEFFGSGGPHFNELNQFVYTARARGGDSSVKQKGIYFDGANSTIVRAESDPALGLSDLPPNPSGDELFGNSFGSFHLLNDGRIGSQDNTLQEIHSTRRPAVFYGANTYLQTGVDSLSGATWDGMDSNAFYTTPDGANWFIRGDDDGPTTTDDVLVVNGTVVLREGSAVPGSAMTIDGMFMTKLIANGDWYARGDDPVNDDWAVRNGVLLAATGQPLGDGSGDNWGDVISGFTGNAGGDWIAIGKSDSADESTNDVIVFNGTTVVAREGDPIDLDGNGAFDDDAFIGRGNLTSSAFHTNDQFLTDDGVLYFFASLRDGAGNDLGSFGTGGDAFLRIDLATAAPCPGDEDESGDVGFGDLLMVLSNWGACPGEPGCPGDTDDDGQVGFSDLLVVLGSWGPCPG